MNKRYHHHFIGADDTTNQFEIWTNKSVQSMQIEASAEPFRIEYAEAKKLEPVRGSQATLELISQSIFQFVDLHTDTMQDYLVKFYRDNKLYWIGWLDSELYNEQLSATPPYNVTFTASDFNIWERLKYRDTTEKIYTDIASLITHVKRCFDALQLPFTKLYIGCTTVPEGITMTVSETPLHVLYMMSANFYDEDAEPMTLREVVENVLRPFGLMMTQKDANVYIYDYNTIKQSLPMKRYDFSTWAYEADEKINFNLGNLPDIGFMSTDSSYGFEEMINNVQITSSLYGDSKIYDKSVDKDSLSGDPETIEKEDFSEQRYQTDKNIQNAGGAKFIVYTKKENETTLIGASMPYKHSPNPISPIYTIKPGIYLVASDNLYYMNVKANVYVNTRTNPFDSDEQTKESDASRTIRLYCNLYLIDTNGKPTAYYNNDGPLGLWTPIPDGGSMVQGKFCMLFCSETKDDRNLPSIETLDRWIYNSDQVPTDFAGTGFKFDAILYKNYGNGVNIRLSMLDAINNQIKMMGISGYPVLEITNKCMIDNPTFITGHEPFPQANVTNILINNISLQINSQTKSEVSTDDYEFKSYVNKKVATDLADITLKCISANEEKAPIGKANMLKKVGDRYELQLSFTRSGQTDILERLLMCTIHSNFATKNELFTVDIKMKGNPAISYVDYMPILSGQYLVSGCKLDFQRAVTTITAVGYSDDVAKLSSIPYD